jgi:hypothetical protein
MPQAVSARLCGAQRSRCKAHHSRKNGVVVRSLSCLLPAAAFKPCAVLQASGGKIIARGETTCVACRRVRVVVHPQGAAHNLATP